MKFTKEEKMAFVKRYQDGETVLSICNENQIPRSTFYRWIQDYQQTVTDTGTVVTPLEFLYLKRRISKLEDMIQVLKTVSCTVSSPLQEKLKAMEPLYGQFSVHTLYVMLWRSHVALSITTFSAIRKVTHLQQSGGRS